jgi:hypothetical protein
MNWVVALRKVSQGVKKKKSGLKWLVSSVHSCLKILFWG